MSTMTFFERLKYRLSMMSIAWRMSPIAGGSGELDPDPDSGATPPDSGSEPLDPVPEDDPKLGTAGEKALEAFKERARRAEASEKALAAKVKKFEDRDKTDQERTSEELSSIRSDLADATAKNRRLKVALDKKLPAELIDRLKGDTLEELEADAETLLGLVKPASVTDFDQGGRITPREPSLDEQIKAAEGDGDWERAGALKVRKLAATAQ